MKLIKTIEIVIPKIGTVVKIPDILGLVILGALFFVADQLLALDPNASFALKIIGGAIIAIAVLAVVVRYLRPKSDST